MRTVCVQRVSKALFIRPFALETRYAFATTFFTFRYSIVYFLFFSFVNCASFMCDLDLGQQKHSEFRACVVLVPSVRLALV